MGFEGQNDALAATRSGPAHHLVEEYTVSTMHSVVRAHRSHTITKLRGIIEAPNDLHLLLLIVILLGSLHEVGHLLEDSGYIVVLDHNALWKVERCRSKVQHTLDAGINDRNGILRCQR